MFLGSPLLSFRKLYSISLAVSASTVSSLSLFLFLFRSHSSSSSIGISTSVSVTTAFLLFSSHIAYPLSVESLEYCYLSFYQIHLPCSFPFLSPLHPFSLSLGLFWLLFPSSVSLRSSRRGFRLSLLSLPAAATNYTRFHLSLQDLSSLSRPPTRAPSFIPLVHSARSLSSFFQQRRDLAFFVSLAFHRESHPCIVGGRIFAPPTRRRDGGERVREPRDTFLDQIKYRRSDVHVFPERTRHSRPNDKCLQRFTTGNKKRDTRTRRGRNTTFSRTREIVFPRAAIREIIVLML